MSDLFSPFRDAEQLPTPPASEIRQRGDSLRRRRQALQAGGVAAVVAAVAFAGVGLSGGFADRSAEPPVATQGTTSPSPSEPSPTQPSPTQPSHSGAVTTIPESVDLVRDWVDDDGDGEEVILTSGPNVQWLGDVVECEASHSPADESVDHQAVRYSQPEFLQARDLRTFADDATAQRIAEDYVSWFRDCPTFSLDDGASETHNTVAPRRLGDQSWLVSQTYWAGATPLLAENVLVVVRVANTILVTQRYGETSGATNPAASRRDHDELVAEVKPIVAELGCAFGGGC